MEILEKFPRVFCFLKLCINENGGNRKWTISSMEMGLRAQNSKFYSNLLYFYVSEGHRVVNAYLKIE